MSKQHPLSTDGHKLIDTDTTTPPMPKSILDRLLEQSLVDRIFKSQQEISAFRLVYALSDWENITAARELASPGEITDLINSLFQTNLSVEKATLDRTALSAMLCLATTITREARNSNLTNHVDVQLLKFQGVWHDHDYRLYVACTVPVIVLGAFIDTGLDTKLYI